MMTHRDVDDASVLPELLAQIPQATKIEVVIGDGAYHAIVARAAIAACGHCRVRRAGGHPARGECRVLACQPGWWGARAQRGH